MGATKVNVIDITAFESVKQLPCSFTITEIEPYLQDAQEFDMLSCLGEDFWNDLIANYDSTPYTTLIARDDFKRTLVYFAFARWVKDGYYHSTGSNFFARQSDFSRELSKGERDEIYERSRSKAKGYLEQVKEYLSDNNTNFTAYKGGCSDDVSCVRVMDIVKVAR